MTSESEYSPSFYQHHAERYAQVSHDLKQSVYIRSTHPDLKGDLDLIDGLQKLVPPNSRGLDAGCGAGARDIFLYSQDGYDIIGIDAINENVQVARRLHPEISQRLSVHDLTQDLGFPKTYFDFILCNAVIQHIQPESVRMRVLPEFIRVLKVGGVLQLMFKSGSGIATVYDRDYEVDRTFQLYDAEDIVNLLVDLGMEIISAEGSGLGGIMFFTDPKPMEHCVFYARKVK